MKNKPRRRKDNRNEFVREVMRPLWDLEATLRRKRSSAVNRNARFVDGKIQKCPTRSLRARPKIIFDTREAAEKTQREFSRIGADETHPYPCSYGGDSHWHLGRLKDRPE